VTTLHGHNLSEAMRCCREITRKRARNFYYGLKLLPEPRRSALYAMYAWMRRADDLADGAAVEADEARRRIAAFRAETERALAGHADVADPILVALGETAARYPIRPEHFGDMLDGQLDDLNGRTYRTFADLREYCGRVASSVGQVCIEIWGYHDDRAPELAVDRGIAFQLTNILRDFAEDYDSGRVYLPLEDFEQADLEPEVLRRWTESDKCSAFVLRQVERAELFYTRSQPLDHMITASCVPTLWAMTEIYHRLLQRLRAEPGRLALGPPVRLSAAHKGAIAVRARWRARGARDDVG
jgi:phytoene synthase